MVCPSPARGRVGVGDLPLCSSRLFPQSFNRKVCRFAHRQAPHFCKAHQCALPLRGYRENPHPADLPCSCKKSEQKNTPHAPALCRLLWGTPPAIHAPLSRAHADAASCSRLSPGHAYSPALRWHSQGFAELSPFARRKVHCHFAVYPRPPLPAHPATVTCPSAGANGGPGF